MRWFIIWFCDDERTEIDCTTEYASREEAVTAGSQESAPGLLVCSEV